jgi:hypothetical protein
MGTPPPVSVPPRLELLDPMHPLASSQGFPLDYPFMIHFLFQSTSVFPTTLLLLIVIIILSLGISYNSRITLYDVFYSYQLSSLFVFCVSLDLAEEGKGDSPSSSVLGLASSSSSSSSSCPGLRSAFSHAAGYAHVS